MRILYISNKSIYPKIDGGCVAMHNFLNCLIETKVTIKHFSLSTHKHPFSKDNYPEEITKKTSPEGLYIDTRVKLKSAFLNLFSKRSYNVKRFYSKEVEKTLIEHLQGNNYDKIIVETIFLAPYLKIFIKYSKAKVIVRSHNIEFKIWEKLSANENKTLKKWYLSKLAKNLKREEIHFLSKVDNILTLSIDDEKELKKLGIKTKIDSIPVAITTHQSNKNYHNSNFYHIGAMNWKPNIEAVEILTKSIFPAITNKIEDAKLILAGSFMEKMEDENGIIYKGFVEDINEFISEQGILLAPILSGSGVRIKILESMACGTPVITTTLGAEGISAKSGKVLYIAKNQKEFVNFAIELASSFEKRKEIGNNARQFILEKHNKTSIIKELSGILEK